MASVIVMPTVSIPALIAAGTVATGTAITSAEAGGAIGTIAGAGLGAASGVFSNRKEA